MRALGLQIVPLIASLTPALAFQPHIFLSNPSVNVEAGISKRNPTAISGSTARLLLADTLGVKRYHSVGHNYEEAFQILSEHSTRNAGFGNPSEGDAPTAIIFIEGAEDLNDVIPDEVSQQAVGLMLHEATSLHANRQLLSDLMAQRDNLDEVAKASRPVSSPFYSNVEDQLESALLDSSSSLRWRSSNSHLQSTIIHSEILDNTQRSYGPASSQYKDAASVVKKTVKAWYERTNINNWNLIVAVMPFSSHDSKVQKRSASPWGTYDLPIKVRQEDEWQVDTNPTASEDADVTPLQNSAPLGILPECYISRDECIKTTRNCSGHGSCNTKYSYTVDDSTIRCFACSCRSSVQKNADGSNKITKWAGPACQKVDVSTPFWLLGGITLGLVSVIGWAIGLLYSMGQQELPSVIGAGVSGPRPR